MYKPAITIPVEGYHATKTITRRRFTLLRSWNRLSKLQRYLLYCLLSLIVLMVLLSKSPRDNSLDSPPAAAAAEDKAPIILSKLKSSYPKFVGNKVDANKAGPIDRIITPDPEDNQNVDEELGNDSVGGGGGAEVQNEIPEIRSKLTKIPTALEEVQEGMVMPKPRIFAGPGNERQQSVVKAFQHAWKAYERYAWGKDELKPLSKSFSEWFQIGLTIVDSLDTMYIMGLTKEFDKARKWVENDLHFDKDVDVNLFEITIRGVGGLLSAYHLSGDDIFREKAIDLGERLLGAFSTETGVPYSDVNLRKHAGHAPKWGPDSSSAEVTTVQLEFRDLSYVSNNPKFEKAAFRVSEHFHKLEKKDGLIPIFVNAITGEFRKSSPITFGARGDSYYEYLLKQWIQVGKSLSWLLEDFQQAMLGTRRHLLRESFPNKLTFIGELISEHFSPKMDALVCFLPGTLTLGVMHGLSEEHLELAEKLLYTCNQMYERTETKLGPEIAHFNINNGEVPKSTEDIFIKDNDAHALLRPEYVESLFYMYRHTKNTTFQNWGWNVFQAIERHAKIPGAGYASIDDVRAKKIRHRDKMESFLLSETFKYLYLLFSDDQSVLPLDEYVFNSEAHPLPIRRARTVANISSSTT